ncbi:thiol-disulfide oxidoreductase DCC family protein [Nibricoccus sp. IMCC34717]|uniref:thiol-disulfide oxidoreductase DCC family protein n=1 Tax=Nibricoccus sp. IMCC34717 TaxID=3034021 RepID=UPI0038503A60
MTTTDSTPAGRALVLFDADCGLCNALVTWLAKRDRCDRLRFSTLQGPLGMHLVGGDLNSIVYFEKVPEAGTRPPSLTKTNAVCRIFAELPAPWRWLAGLRVVPRPLRDCAYRGIARMRYALFGQHSGSRHREVERRMI